MGGIYTETVIYSSYFVMEIKQFCTSKTFSIVPSLNQSCPSCPKLQTTLSGSTSATKKQKKVQFYKQIFECWMKVGDVIIDFLPDTMKEIGQ